MALQYTFPPTSADIKISNHLIFGKLITKFNAIICHDILNFLSYHHFQLAKRKWKQKTSKKKLDKPVNRIVDEMTTT